MNDATPLLGGGRGRALGAGRSLALLLLAAGAAAVLVTLAAKDRGAVGAVELVSVGLAAASAVGRGETRGPAALAEPSGASTLFEPPAMNNCILCQWMVRRIQRKIHENEGPTVPGTKPPEAISVPTQNNFIDWYKSWCDKDFLPGVTLVGKPTGTGRRLLGAGEDSEYKMCHHVAHALAQKEYRDFITELAIQNDRKCEVVTKESGMNADTVTAVDSCPPQVICAHVNMMAGVVGNKAAIGACPALNKLSVLDIEPADKRPKGDFKYWKLSWLKGGPTNGNIFQRSTIKWVNGQTAA